MKGTGRLAALFLGIVMLLATGCASSKLQTAPSSSGASTGTASASAGRVPAPAHTIVVVMENHAYSEVIGSSAAPFLNQLAREGSVFTHSYAITHPSEPNYLALFSGSTHGVTSDSCPVDLTAPNLAADLIAAGKTFAGYSEDLPSVGSAVCSAGEYARKHVPWTDFRNVPSSVSVPFASFPATDFSRLPTVSFVIPNLCDDMHDCSVATGDAWLRAHLSGYASWAMTHDSLLIVTWDEDDGSQSNQIPTIFVGQQVRPGRYAERITHYSVLATLEAAYGLPRDGNAANVTPITDIWRS
jgi:phosphatidylinositol-3-phosphatase